MADKLESDIRSALDGDEPAYRAFASLPPSHKKEYLRWVGETKRPETRIRRISQMLERLKA